MKPMPSKQVLCNLLDYDPDSGLLTWKHRPESMFTTPLAAKRWNSRLANKPAFTADDGNGYKCGTLLGENYKAHQVIFMMIHGYLPEQIDHQDHDRSNNRNTNLLPSDQAKNRRNQKLRDDNKTGHPGVERSKNKKRWVATIILASGKGSKYIGTFDTVEEAIQARKDAQASQGYHPNHGVP